jgi:hypothetical protein
VNFFEELRSLVAALEGAAIEYAICGGVALAIHGAPRATQDIDILLRPEDLDRVRAVAKDNGFVFESLPMDFASGLTIVRFTKLIEAQPLMLDVLLVGPGQERIWADRLRAPFEGGVIGVVSRQGLISLKAAAARPQDLADLQRLAELDRG